MKLRWAEISGGSEKHVTDALRVYEVQHEKLEQAYLDQWAATLGVVQLLRHIRDEAKPA